MRGGAALPPAQELHPNEGDLRGEECWALFGASTGKVHPLEGSEYGRRGGM